MYIYYTILNDVISFSALIHMDTEKNHNILRVSNSATITIKAEKP